MGLHKQLIKIQFKVDHVHFKERVGILCALLFMIFVPWFFFIYKPQAQAAAQVQQQISDLSNQTATLQRKYDTILMLVKSHNMDKLMLQYENLQHKKQALNQQIMHFQNSYVQDKELASLLYAILKDIQNIKIESFSTLVHTTTNPATPPVEEATKPSKDQVPPTASSPESSLNTTRYSLSLRGDYFKVMQFLQHVERLKWQLFWSTLDYQVTHYPEALATIEFYTLKPTAPPEKPTASPQEVHP